MALPLRRLEERVDGLLLRRAVPEEPGDLRIFVLSSDREDSGYSLALQPDDKIVVTGGSADQWGERLFVMRLMP